MVADTGTLEQPVGDGRGPVAEGHQTDPEAAQSADAVRDVGMHLKAGKAVHDVRDRVLGSAVRRQTGEADPQRLGRNAGERVAGANSGEAKPSRRSPANQVFARYPGAPTS